MPLANQSRSSSSSSKADAAVHWLTSSALVLGGAAVTVAVAAASVTWYRRFQKNSNNNNSDNNSNKNKTVLIVGGGMGGLSAIAGLRRLDPHVGIVLVESKEYMEIHWASYRSPFEAWVAEGSLKSLATFCQQHQVRHVRALVTELTKGFAVLQQKNGEEEEETMSISFDVCVVATGAGSSWPGLGRGPPATSAKGTRQERLEALRAEGARILNASSVLIVGGGLIGTELAGDVAGYARRAGKKKDMKVTLVHSGSQLCGPIMSPPAAGMVQKQLEALGVSVILNERVVKKREEEDDDGKQEEEEEAMVVALEKSGREIQADVVIYTTGFVPINSFLNGIPGALDEKGWIQTDDHFRVSGSDGKLFAIGDCTTTLPNSGNQIMRNVRIIGHNVKAALDGNLTTQMKRVNHGPEIYCSTAGPDGGVFSCPLFWTRYFFPWIKNYTMFFMSPKDMIGIE